TVKDSIFKENAANGIVTARNSQGLLQGNICINTGFGIAISDTASPTLIDNKISENRAGIVISGSSSPRLRNNLIEDNTDDGLTVISQALPDLGSIDSPGGNTIRNNGKFDIQNAGSNTIVSVGNQVDPATVKGKIEFVSLSQPEPTPTPQPEPTPTPQPEPIPTPQPEPIPTPQPEPIPTPQPEPTPTPQPEPIPTPQPEPVPTPQPEPIPTPQPEPVPTPQPKPKLVLTDISNHWAAKFIEELVTLDIIRGYPNRTFRPNATMTRAQFAALLVKAFNPTKKRDPINFKDVSENFWAFQVIQQAYQGKFLSGYPNQTFAPNQNIQRVQVIVSLVNGLGLSPTSKTSSVSFNDEDKIPNYGKDEVIVATQRKMIVNYPDLKFFNPTRDATRAEVAMMVYQALVDANRVAAINSPYIMVG
ncbi:MAG: DUF1565 domain-containing protein, partial [Sphaerospermopsis sp. SIO1G2]|nr:DUF1565 domain-containing protein [Sphaerospermopsis sp. SIO1G2]